MKIPKGIGAVMRSDGGHITVRVLHNWQLFGHDIDDSAMQIDVDVHPGKWEILSQGWIPDVEEPRELGEQVEVNGHTYIRWTTDMGFVEPWINSDDSKFSSWDEITKRGRPVRVND